MSLVEKRELTYCERWNNAPFGKIHLRYFGREGRLLGGLVTIPLCGQRWDNGWDIPSRVDLDAPDVCPACVAVARSGSAGASGVSEPTVSPVGADTEIPHG